MDISSDTQIVNYPAGTIWLNPRGNNGCIDGGNHVWF